MVAQLTVTYTDYSDEKSAETLNYPDITPANLATAESDLAALTTLQIPLVLGVIVKRQFPVVIRSTGVPPTDENAQRENKWLVGYVDSTQFYDAPDNTIPNPGYGKNFTFTIPTAKLEGNLQAQSDFADLTLSVWILWKNSFQSNFKSPYGGVPIVKYVKFVGKDN